jgi:aldehyde dehydrogenase (NAD+)
MPVYGQTLTICKERALSNLLQHYINGEWVTPAELHPFDVINPATEEPIGQISLGTKAEVDQAVAAARAAFDFFSRYTRQEKVELLGSILGVYSKRINDIAQAISSEMGAPAWLATQAQAPTALGHFGATREALKTYQFATDMGSTRVLKEPIGVCGLITPWNWPINQITCKVAAALAAGCTMVLKPSEIAPLSAHIFAEVLHEAGVPKGVFNLVNGDGPTVGALIAGHPGIDMVSFTGSTRAGILVAKAAADTVKRVAQELGGKSANILLDDADLQRAVTGGLHSVFMNSGQNCIAPSRMLVPESLQDKVVEIAKAAAGKFPVGKPDAEGTFLGPVVNEAQWNKIQGLIQSGIDQGATLVCGGTGKPQGLEIGYYVKPTIFADVRSDMTIANQEIFGPVLTIMPYDTEENAIRLANETPYGLSGYVSSADLERARKVAAQLRTGMVHLNGAQLDVNAPFGGYKQSGNGREWGGFGIEEFVEVKSVMGYAA